MAGSQDRRERPNGFWKRWWQLLLFAIASPVVIWVVPETLGWDRFQVTQVCVTVCSTVFVGMLGRNSSRDQAAAAQRQSEEQADAARKQSKVQAKAALEQSDRQAERAEDRFREQELRAREARLVDRQAVAVGHLCSDNTVEAACGVTELVWLVQAWCALSDDSWAWGQRGGVDERWERHAQELVDLAYRTSLDDGGGYRCGRDLSDPVTRARSKGFLDLIGRLNVEKEWLKWTPFASLDFDGAYLSYADLSHVGLTCVDLTEADLVGAALSGADLSYAVLTRADLSYANLSGAALSGADLSGAILSGVNLSEADLSGADLLEANLSAADLKYAIYNNKTRFPDGFERDAHGMTRVEIMDEL